MKKLPLVDLSAQYQAIKPEIDAAIQRVLDNTSFILGKEVAEFEAAFAEFCEAKHCVGLASGTAALQFALLACGVQAGDEVITTTHTFIATAEAISYCGAKPIFVDIDPQTYNMDTAQVATAVTPRTKAIIAVHLYGQPADMAPLSDIAKKHNLALIEDAAQAHAATYDGVKVGNLGDVTCFSFYPGKNLGAYGDGGAIVTNDDGIAERVQMLRNHGRKPNQKYEHEIIGYGERLDALQAAILRVKLAHLGAWTEARQAHAAVYDELLADLPVERPFVPDNIQHAYHLYVIQVADKRDEILKQLKEQGIGAGVHYPMPLHLQPAYRHLEYEAGEFPKAEHAATHVLSLPMFPEMTRADIERVADTLRHVLQG